MKEPKITICLQVPLKLKEAIEREAENQSRSVNQTVIRILRQKLGVEKPQVACEK